MVVAGLSTAIGRVLSLIGAIARIVRLPLPWLEPHQGLGGLRLSVTNHSHSNFRGINPSSNHSTHSRNSICLKTAPKSGLALPLPAFAPASVTFRSSPMFGSYISRFRTTILMISLLIFPPLSFSCFLTILSSAESVGPNTPYSHRADGLVCQALSYFSKPGASQYYPTYDCCYVFLWKLCRSIFRSPKHHSPQPASSETKGILATCVDLCPRKRM